MADRRRFPTFTHGRRAQRGLALVIALWAGALMAVMAAAFAFSVRSEVRIATAAVGAAQAQSLAEAGISRAILGLATSNRDERWTADDREYRLSLPEGEVRVRATQENARIDLNAAPRALLTGLVNSVLARLDDEGVDVDSREIVDAILDWRDSNDTRRLNGAEDAEYRRAGLTYGAGDRPFLSVEELQRVLGVTDVIYQAMAPLLTVFSSSPRVDPLLAERDVLAAVPGLSAEAIDRFIAARDTLVAQAQGDELLERDRRALSRRVLLLARGLSPTASRYLASGRAAVYTLVAQGRTASGATAVREVTVRVTASRSRPVQVLTWRESAEWVETDEAEGSDSPDARDNDDAGGAAGALPNPDGRADSGAMTRTPA